MTDAELVAIFLKTGTRGKTALDLARELLNEHCNLKKLLLASPFALMKKPGIGSAKYAALKAAIELGRRYFNETRLVGEKLDNSHVLKKFLAGQLGEHPNEVFACVFMDNHFRLMSFEKLFQGTIHSASIYPREIVRRGLAHNAAKVVLAHNHPSGHPHPSAADKEVTILIQEALALVDIEVVDHIIIGSENHFSFVEAGLMS